MNSALFEGRIRHRRFSERNHRLDYPVFMLYVDLDEIDLVFAGSRLWSSRGPAWAWLRREDYFGDSKQPWADVVRDRVEEHCGRRPLGSVALLTIPRTLGIRMNPVSFYYCQDSSGELEAVVAEITNTPWDERHLYVVHRDQLEKGEGPPSMSSETQAPPWKVWLNKHFHVSPFLPMDLRYRWVLNAPRESLIFHMENYRGQEKLFDATLSLNRKEITPASLRRVLLGHPWMTARIIFWIYLHAAILKIKGVRFHTHPKHLERNAP